MEDFNIPSTERKVLLARLQEYIDGGPPYFWAACQLCDLKRLENLVKIARKDPEIVRVIAASTYKMVVHCKLKIVLILSYDG
jgi:hypothetical protein